MKYKEKIMDILLWVGLTIAVIIYLVLKILGVLRSPTIEEVLLAVVFGHSIILGHHEIKFPYLEKSLIRIERRIDNLENKVDKLLKR